LLTRTGALLGVLSTHWAYPHRPSEHELYLLDLYAREAVDVLDRIQTAHDLQRSFDQLRALAARLQSVREEERKKLARELHDELGQSLTAVKMELTSLSFEWPGEQNPFKRIQSITRLVDRTVQSVRKIATELRPGILDAMGLAAAIEWAATDFETRTGTKCRVRLPKAALQAGQEQATTIFRIFQETLTNIARHACATQVNIRLAREADGTLTLTVRDNGIGFSEARLAESGALGIIGMRERALLLGGEFQISGSPKHGTRITVSIPLSPSRHMEEVV
jgi:signal transduction histidine kinase